MRHEPVIYAFKDTVKHKFYGDRKQTTVWEFDKSAKSELHPTQKSLPLIAYPMRLSSMEDGIVVDLFGGSGSKRINGNYDSLIYDKTIDQDDVYGWNHYHLGEKKGGKVARIEEIPYRWAHSFFGLLYINTDGNYTTYPSNP